MALHSPRELHMHDVASSCTLATTSRLALVRGDRPRGGGRVPSRVLCHRASWVLFSGGSTVPTCEVVVRIIIVIPCVLRFFAQIFRAPTPSWMRFAGGWMVSKPGPGPRGLTSSRSADHPRLIARQSPWKLSTVSTPWQRPLGYSHVCALALHCSPVGCGAAEGTHQCALFLPLAPHFG